MREKIIRFMNGRYGPDQFSRFLLGAAVAAAVLSMVFHWRLFYYLSFLLIIYGYFRILSRDFGKRSKENAAYLHFTGRFWNMIGRRKNEREQRKNYHIYKCPECGQKIRIPKGKGKIEITCPKCGKRFIKNRSMGI